MYADDTVIYSSRKSKSKIEEDLEFDLNRISNYFKENELIVNLKKSKTETMIFGTAKHLANKIPECQLQMPSD